MKKYHTKTTEFVPGDRVHLPFLRLSYNAAKFATVLSYDVAEFYPIRATLSGDQDPMRFFSYDDIKLVMRKII